MGELNWVRRVYGVVLLCVTTAIAAPAQTFTTLHSFDGTDGADPIAGLVQATNGSLYGTTEVDGANGYGTFFKITPSGKLATLFSFCSQTNCTDGAEPFAGLVQATDGNLYGTTIVGGANFPTYPGGTVFEITPSGKLTTLYSFCSQTNCTDGTEPAGLLIQATDGGLYGTTLGGGANGYGTVFKITPSGKLTTLHSFDGTDGNTPFAGLVQATDGKFYGTTYEGGANNEGTVFKITPSGTLTTMHSFDVTDGDEPVAGLVQAADGNLYGTTTGDGASSYGTVFKITLRGRLTTLHSFDVTDGDEPGTGLLIQATDGNLYGTTIGGGANGFGTVFEITPRGRLTTLHSFDGTDGGYPYAMLVQDTNGSFYGTTSEGGANNDGTVFSLSVGLGPFMETLPASGKVGAAVKILGTHLTGATSVSFNGTAAVFKVVSSSEITTTVPTGATTGKVKVTTPSGTLTSNVNFRVTP
jgi:uncharacterized repeat protein (TIGR03803 family)